MARQRTQTGDDKQIALNENKWLALQSHLEQWNSCKGGECHAVLNAAVKEARLLAPKMDKDALKHRKYMYKQWFYNNGACKQRIRKHLIKYGRKWTARETGMKPGEKGMMKHYQWVVMEIMQGLTSDELKEAKATTLAWSQEGPPADIQTNIAKTKGESLMKHFATEMYRQARMRIFMVSAWKEQDEKLMIGGHDFNDKIGSSERFMDTKDWQVILEEWNPYAEEQFNMQEGTDDRVICGKTQQVRQLFHFELDNVTTNGRVRLG
ncbi:uncharacterized protein F5147DRAFT_771390 [Suillus discolor]|uniref:Uncharacterized protein n=1 Tax=Suillus discolor TaxID=1912936 RepID=A0A9P7FCF7_9AGAM|nr:uncharacterized protein F5147DRAFT_771390 [Suillus discolor]KAG2112329.1 hypothetical protein F5147DRAFT_771390 [Suillus discolor]